METLRAGFDRIAFSSRSAEAIASVVELEQAPMEQAPTPKAEGKDKKAGPEESNTIPKFPPPKLPLSLDTLRSEAERFTVMFNSEPEKTKFDGKSIGTFVEQRLFDYLAEKYVFRRGNSAKGLDFPDLNVDVKATSERQPQGSCPYKHPSQKVFGLGYGLLVFVYQKQEEVKQLTITRVQYFDHSITGDCKLTNALRNVLDKTTPAPSVDAIISVLRGGLGLPINNAGLQELAETILENPDRVVRGALTISNALQLRLQYKDEGGETLFTN